MPDTFKSVRAALAGARLTLAGCQEAAPQVTAIQNVEYQLTRGHVSWHGDREIARRHLDPIMKLLNELRRTRPAVVTNFYKLEQKHPEPALLPRVADAIADIRRGCEVLKPTV